LYLKLKMHFVANGTKIDNLFTSISGASKIKSAACSLRGTNGTLVKSSGLEQYSLTTLRVKQSKKTNLPLNMSTILYFEWSVSSYEPTLHNILEKQTP
jgi:hypothetical protein